MLETLQFVTDAGRVALAYLFILVVTGGVCGMTRVVEGEEDPDPVIGAGELPNFGARS